MPPVPAFYHLPATVADIVDQTVGRDCSGLTALDRFELDARIVQRWDGGDEG